MKLNIKGLVFVGFAAAVFASAAQAVDGDKIVTSKSYVDSKIVNTMAGNEENKAPSVAAVKGLVGAEYTGTSPISVDETTHVISTTAQPNVIETVKVNGTGLTPDANKAVDVEVPVTTVKVNDTALTPDSNHAVNITVATGDTTTGNIKVNGVNVTPYGLGTAAGVDTTTDTTFEVVADAGKLPTAATVKAYVDAHSASGAEENVQADWSVTDTSSDAFIKNKPTTLNDFTDDIDAANIIDSITIGGTAATITSKTVALGAAAGKGADTSITSSATDNNVATAKAVYDYLNVKATGATCSAEAPCALVLAGGVPTWQPIEQPAAN